MEQTLHIWTEGGRDIGLGHVKRCLSIARELKKRNYDVKLLINNDRYAIEWIERKGFSYEIAGFNKDFTFRYMGEGLKVALIDTKKPVTREIYYLKNKGFKVAIMDNVTEARLAADIVIYPAVVLYDNLEWHGYNEKVYNGAAYVPVADSFLKKRLETENEKPCPPYRVLVTMGGVDPNNITSKIVLSLLQSHLPMTISIVVGPAFTSTAELEEIEKLGYPNLFFIKGYDDLSDIVARSHIAITALGTTLYELSCLGIPSVIISNYRDDQKDMEAFSKLGIALPLGYYQEVRPADIRMAVEMLLADTGLWEMMSRNGRMLIDGKGASRIADIIIALKENAKLEQCRGIVRT